MPQPTDTATLYEIYRKHSEVTIDSRRAVDGCLFFGLRGRTDGNQYAAAALSAGAAYAVVDKAGVIPDTEERDRYLLVDDCLAALQQLATMHRNRLRIPVLAITGSNGKTTTKELTAAVMRTQYATHATAGNYNNHIGVPLTLLATPPGTDVVILEMGANHQGEIAALCEIGRPSHGIITNIGDAHLEGFGGREGVIKGKGELFDYLARSRGVAFVNRDEEPLPEMAERVARTIFYQDSDAPSPTTPGLETKIERLYPTVSISFLDAGGELVRAETHLSGEHNLQNVKTAVAIGKYFKVPCGRIASALKGYTPDNHRSQWLTHRDVRFYWDAYNANPSSVAAALHTFAATEGSSAQTDVIILGEMLELGEDSAAAHRCVVMRAGQIARTVLLVGDELLPVATEFDRPHFADSSRLAEWFWNREWSGRRVFVKGSRGNRLERLLD